MEKVLVGNLEAKGPFARLRLRWVEGMILKDFFEGGGALYWTDMARDRDKRRGFAKALVKFWVA